MTTTYYDFTGSASTSFSFSPTLDGTVYIVKVRWGLFGQRYYVNISTTDGTLIVELPLIGSPSDTNISLTKGYFTTQLVWRVENLQFEVID